jgi:NIMA (never in mitosis gene a)-related kinase
MEFAENGDLQTLIESHKKRTTFLKEEQIWSILIDLLRGLQALHKLKIVHRDIKCANVFLGADGKAKLGDMNVSKIAKRGFMQTQTGTPYYASPEVWNDKPYDSKCDIWSLGCVIYELAALNPPFQARDMASLYQKVNKGIYPNLPMVFSNDLT